MDKFLEDGGREEDYDVTRAKGKRRSDAHGVDIVDDIQALIDEDPGRSMRGIARELTVVHGWGDDLVPAEAILEFARSQQAMLHLVPAGHALLEQLEWLEQIFTLFLQRCLEPEQVTQKSRILATL